MSVSEDAYDLLDKLKLKDESFSEVIRRLAKRRSLADCANPWEDIPLEEMAVYHKVMGDLRSGAFGTKELQKV